MILKSASKRRKRLSLLLPSLLAYGAVGCGAEEDLVVVSSGAASGFETLPDGGTPSVLSQLPPDSEAANIVKNYNQLLVLARARADYFCECEHQTTEGEEFERCLRELNPQNPPPVLECTRRVLSESPQVLPSLLCEKKINQAYMDCVQAAPSCLDFDHITDCEIDRITADLECEEFPYDVWFVDQKRCWGNERPPPFECENGKVVSSEQRCDFADDCGDRSDESDCADDPHGGVDR